jgi:protein-disulfide isomerase
VSVLTWLALSACTHPTPPAASASAAPPAWVGARSGVGDLPEVVAHVNGEPVTADALAAFDPPALLAAEAALADARREVLEQLVLQTLVHQQATAAGLADDAWILRAVEGHWTPVTDAEVTAFYEQNADQIAQPLPEVKDSVRAYLDDQRRSSAVGALLSGLRREAKVESHLPRFRVAVDGAGAPRQGPEAAPVQIVEFSDFQCPYCARASEVVKEVRTAYGDRVSVTYRHFPLEFHPQAHRAAEAAACADEQGSFWAFHDALFADQKAWADGNFDGVAERARVNAKALRECLASGRTVARVDADTEIGHRVGTSGTPAFFVNGVLLSGAQPFEAFAELIDAELAGR